MTQAFPLYWPDGWPRTPASARRWSLAGGRRNTPPWNQTLGRLKGELARIGAKHVVLSTNQPLRQDGQPYQQQRVIEDPGAAVYFELKGRAMVMAQDEYQLLLDNIRSLAIAIEHLRGLERHGGGTMMERAFAGFEALPRPGVNGRAWWIVLGFGSEAEARRGDVEAAFRRLARERHPDLGGSAEQMAELNVAMDQARGALAA